MFWIMVSVSVLLVWGWGFQASLEIRLESAVSQDMSKVLITGSMKKYEFQKIRTVEEVSRRLRVVRHCQLTMSDYPVCYQCRARLWMGGRWVVLLLCKYRIGQDTIGQQSSWYRQYSIADKRTGSLGCHICRNCRQIASSRVYVQCVILISL